MRPPRKVSLQITIAPRQAEWLQARARAIEGSVSEVVRQVLDVERARQAAEAEARVATEREREARLGGIAARGRPRAQTADAPAASVQTAPNQLTLNLDALRWPVKDNWSTGRKEEWMRTFAPTPAGLAYTYILTQGGSREQAIDAAKAVWIASGLTVAPGADPVETPSAPPDQQDDPETDDDYCGKPDATPPLVRTAPSPLERDIALHLSKPLALEPSLEARLAAMGAEVEAMREQGDIAGANLRVLEIYKLRREAENA